MSDTLLLSLQIGSSERSLVVSYDDQTLISDLADALGEAQGGGKGVADLIVSNRNAALAPGMRISESNLRSGDTVQIQWLTNRSRGGVDEIEPAQLRIVSGTSNGLVMPLRFGVNTVGRGADSDVPIDDGLASRYHLALDVTDVVSVSDLGSTNGTTVNGEPLVEAIVLGPQDVVEVGDTRFVVVQMTNVDAVRTETGPHVRFNRPPRVVPPYVGVKVEIPAPPGEPPRQRLPMVAAIIPVLLAIFMYLLTKNITSILFMAMSPVMMLGSYWENKRGTRADHAAAVEDWRERVAEIIELLVAERDREIERRREESPSLGETRRYVEDRSPRLWERGTEEQDFLSLRVGIADLPSRTSIKTQSGGSRKLRIEIEDIPEQFETVPSVPLALDLVDDYGVGIAGSGEESTGLARFIVAQAAALHSPAELTICAAIGDASRPDWEWLRWLPHVHASTLPVFPLATDQHHVVDLLEALEEAVGPKADDVVGDDVGPTGPHCLLILDDSVPIERSRIVPFLKRMRGGSLSFVWIGEELGTLPRPCGAVAEIGADPESATVSVVASGSVHHPVVIEKLSRTDAESMARQLAPIVDVTHADAEGALPTSVTLVDLLGGDDVLDDPEVVKERWHESELSVGKKSSGLRAVVGMSSAPLTIDIRRDGPHALVAGTTGAGKSEFLQTWVASLAASHRPERVTFLFVDYKGGSAFKDCVDLPHTVGLVTDLDAHQVQRALTSLNAELHRRERILNEADAKDLVQMEEMGHPDTPANLLIVVDEFAALAKEVPEFVDGVVNIAQRGRSLGLHLILATQRPAGVVTDNIRANTNLRIALRMADTSESVDVVGSPVAASFSRTQPGRGVARVGPSELLTFQSGFAGARTNTDVQGPHISIGYLGFDGVDPIDGASKAVAETIPDGPIDLERLVSTISTTHNDLGGKAPRRPWQEPLPETIDLLDPMFPTVGTPEQVYIGVRDEPELQGRAWVTIRPESEGSWLVVGTSGSGKTTFLRTVAASLGVGRGVDSVEVYGLDFGGRGLQLLEDLPHVGSVIPGADVERVTRLFRYLDTVMRDRSDEFAAHRVGNLDEYRSAVPDSGMRRVFVLLDGMPAFLQTFERVDRGRWLDLLPVLIAGGRQTGVHFVLTSDRRSGLPLALTSNIQRVFTLRLAGSDDYAAAGVPSDILTSKSVPGRAIDGDHEAQIAVPGGLPDGSAQGRAIVGLGERMRDEGIGTIPEIASLPGSLMASGLGSIGGRIVLGISDVDLSTASIDAGIGTFAIFGPGRSGKTTALRRIAHSLKDGQPGGRIVFGASRRRANLDGPWDGAATGDSDVATLVKDSLVAILDGHSVAVLLDDVVDLLDGEAGVALTDLVRALREHPGLLVVSADSSQARRAYSDGMAEIRSAKSGLLLQPDFDFDGDLLGVSLSRPGGRVFPPGRGYLVVRGMADLVQIGTDDWVEP